MSEYTLENEWKAAGAHQHFTTWLCDKIESMRDGISDMKTQLTERAEAAEARAAELLAEVEHQQALVNSWISHAEQLEAHLAGTAQTVTQLTRERDEARQERDNLRMSIVNNVSA